MNTDINNLPDSHEDVDQALANEVTIDVRGRFFGHFEDHFLDTMKRAYCVNVVNGFHEDREAIKALHPAGRVIIGLAAIGLAHTELSEAVEAIRKHDPATWSDHTTKDTLVRELAGAIVRIMDYAASEDLPLAMAIVAEIQTNSQRGYKHGGKAA